MKAFAKRALLVLSVWAAGTVYLSVRGQLGDTEGLTALHTRQLSDDPDTPYALRGVGVKRDAETMAVYTGCLGISLCVFWRDMFPTD